MNFLSKSGVFIEDFLGIPGFDIYWYGVCIAAGFLLAFLLASYSCRRRGYRSDLAIDMLIVILIGAMIGARGYYVVFEWNRYYVPGDFLATLKNIVDIRSGGLAIYGGIIGGVIALMLYCRFSKEKYRFLQLLDICAAPLALGQAIGRWGNFFNQEAHGALVENPSLQFFPYAVYLDDPKGLDPAGWYQATFFYESVWCLGICIFLTWFFFRQKYHGQLTLLYFALYGFERGIVEWLRTDQLTVGNIPVSAVLSIVLCLAAIVILVVLRIKNYTTEMPLISIGTKKRETETPSHPAEPEPENYDASNAPENEEK